MLHEHRKLWWLLGGALLLAFTVLGVFGAQVYRQKPPIPARVVTTDGRQLMTGDDILTGQQVWQSTGGQQLGSIWGHGAYQAPDWSADWLHREALALLDIWAERQGAASFAALPATEQAALKSRLPGALQVPGLGDLLGVLREDPFYVVRIRGPLATAKPVLDPFPFLGPRHAAPEAAPVPFTATTSRRIPRWFR